MIGQATTLEDAPAIGAAIEALDFAGRKESWVASSEGRFYKIFRSSDDPARDWLDPACIEKASHEYADMQLLRRLSDRVCGPLERDHACIVYPRLSGPDLRVILLRRADDEGQRAAALRDAVRLLARLHAATDAVSHYTFKDYSGDGYLQPGPDVLRRIAARDRTLCIEGFEVRNFRYDDNRNAWLFFDPQQVHLGVPENDLARFIISLLMVNWGKGGSPKIWRDFDAGDLVSVYEHASTRIIDKPLFNHFLHETIAMRRHFADKALRLLHGTRRVLGQPYLIAYFMQLEKWATSHEF